MSNFNKRFVISLLALPLIYILLYQPTLFNSLIVITFLFCTYEWIKIFKKKNLFFLIGLFILFIFLISLLKIYNSETFILEHTETS